MYNSNLIKLAIEHELKQRPHYLNKGVSLSDIATDIEPLVRELNDSAYREGYEAAVKYFKNLADKLYA